MLGKIRITAIAVAVTLACSGLATAYDRDNDKGDYTRKDTETRKHRPKGHDRGRDDRDARRNRDNDRNRGWQRGDGDRDDRGSANWRDHDGYGRRNPSVYQNNQGWHRDGDADDGIYNRGGVYNRGRGNYPYGQQGYPQRAFGGNPGFRFGYGDGAKVAREDMVQGKPYNPNPRGKYDDRDGGYQSVDGDKNAYRAQYSNGYRAGYEAAFRRR